MKKVIVCSVAVTAALLAWLLSQPVKTCSVEWLDRDLNRTEGPFKDCYAPKKLPIRKMGEDQYARVGADVYRMKVNVVSEDGGFPCMTGVACFPIPTLAHEWKTIEFIKLDGPVNFNKLAASSDGHYLSDGVNQFNDWHRIVPLSPPLNLQRLRPADPRRSEKYPETTFSRYVTDLKWVLLDENVLPDADPATFQVVVARTPVGTADESQQFGRDRLHVYYGEKIIEGADPESFGVVVYDDSPLPADAEYRGSLIGTDNRKVWVLHADEWKPVIVSKSQFAALRRDLETSVKAHLTSSTENKSPSCNKCN